MKYEYETLKNTYGDFEQPVINVTVEGKGFGDNGAGMIVGEAQVDLTSGFEASEAVYRIYNCTDEKDGAYLFDKLKPYIMLGSYTVIELGYAGAKEEVFRGFVARVEFVCEESGAPLVEVAVSDIKGAMMSGSSQRQLAASNYADAVKEILKGQPYQNLGQKGLARQVKVTDTPDKRSSGRTDQGKIEMTAESDYEFVVKAAKKFHYEFFTEPGILYFRKAKEDKTPLLVLGPGKGLLSYRIVYDIRGLIEEAEVRNTDDGKGTLIKAVKKCKNKISFGSRANAVLAGSKKVYMDASVRTKEDASYRARSILEDNSWRFGILECECIGIPVLRPGHFIDISGIGKGADNQFYITGVQHVIAGESGYRTRLWGQAASL